MGQSCSLMVARSRDSEGPRSQDHKLVTKPEQKGFGAQLSSEPQHCIKLCGHHLPSPFGPQHLPVSVGKNFPS